MDIWLCKHTSNWEPPSSPLSIIYSKGWPCGKLLQMYSVATALPHLLQARVPSSAPAVAAEALPAEAVAAEAVVAWALAEAAATGKGWAPVQAAATAGATVATEAGAGGGVVPEVVQAMTHEEAVAALIMAQAAAEMARLFPPRQPGGEASAQVRYMEVHHRMTLSLPRL
jgi:hypothetical protein